jgi:hypothetical protein
MTDKSIETAKIETGAVSARTLGALGALAETTAPSARAALTVERSYQLDQRARKLTARLISYALLALRTDMSAETLASTLTQGLQLDGFKTEPIPLPIDETDIAAGLTVTAAQLSATLTDLHELARVTEFALRDRPRGLDDIVTQLLVALAEFERASADVTRAAVAWGDEALTGPALKQECLAELVAGGKSASAAKDAVTAHPRYAAHKERLDALLREKYDAETAQTTAKTRVHVLQEVAAVMRTAVEARSSRFSVTRA